MALQTDPPLPKPRFTIVDLFPITTLAPYVGASAEAIAWCEANQITKVRDLRRAMARNGKVPRMNCSDAMRLEFLRLLEPAGVPADWPLHPDPRLRIDQQVTHTSGLSMVLSNALLNAQDRWEGFLYLIHYEEDFTQYKGVGPTTLPKVLAWRSDMRKRHERPEYALGPDVLKGRDWSYAKPMQPLEVGPYESLWKAAATHGAQGYVGTIRTAGRAVDGSNHICFVTAQTAFTARWPDWAFALAKDALLSRRSLFVMARGQPFGPELLEVHLLAEQHSRT